MLVGMCELKKKLKTSCNKNIFGINFQNKVTRVTKRKLYIPSIERQFSSKRNRNLVIRDSLKEIESISDNTTIGMELLKKIFNNKRKVFRLIIFLMVFK